MHLMAIRGRGVEVIFRISASLLGRHERRSLERENAKSTSGKSPIPMNDFELNAEEVVSKF